MLLVPSHLNVMPMIVDMQLDAAAIGLQRAWVWSDTET
jgi:hypothetical protein